MSSGLNFKETHFGEIMLTHLFILSGAFTRFYEFFNIFLRLRVAKGYHNPKGIFIFVAISPIQIVKQKALCPMPPWLSPDNSKVVEGLVD